ncbi:MAG: hypothetical protein RR376_11840, partial [Janthinobacterium sp.]
MTAWKPKIILFFIIYRFFLLVFDADTVFAARGAAAAGAAAGFLLRFGSAALGAAALEASFGAA